MMTPEDELSYCDRTDNAFDVLLGQTLAAATIRLGAIAVVICAVAAAVSKFVA